jgi:hypothetical protein
MTPIKKRKSSKPEMNKKSSQKLTMQENLPPKQQIVENELKSIPSLIFPRKTLIIDDDETPVKNPREYSTPIKQKNVEKTSPYLRSKRKREVETVKCPICLEPAKEISELDTCHHKFCKECIDQWSNLANTCPVCKEEFKKILYLQEDKTQEKKVKKRKFQYEEEEDETWLQNCADNCMKCGNSDNQHLLLVCDKCNFNICHVNCAGLELIPDEDWLCSECVDKRRTRKTRIVSTPNINTRSKTKRGYSLRSKR